MYVCLCNGFTDRQIREAAERGAYRSATRLHRALGGRVQCGKCLVMMTEMVRMADRAGPMPEAGEFA